MSSVSSIHLKAGTKSKPVKPNVTATDLCVYMTFLNTVTTLN